MNVPIEIMIERILEQMQTEMRMSEEEKEFWRAKIRQKLIGEGAVDDDKGTE